MINTIIELSLLYLPQISIAVVVSGLFTYLFRKRVVALAERYLSLSLSASKHTAQYSVILADYALREFRATSAPIVTVQEAVIDIVPWTPKLLREAKSRAMEKIRIDLRDGTNIWACNSRIEQQTWENKTAFETAIALQQIGVSSYTGIVPLDLVLCNAADVVVDDWIICQNWLASYYEAENIYKTDPVSKAQIFYHRRHARWLFFVALAWMRKEKWVFETPGRYPSFPSEQETFREIRMLTAADGVLMPDSVRHEVIRLTGIDSL